MKKLTAFLILIFLFTLGLAGFKTLTAISHPLKYQNEIIKYANEYNLAPELVASVINAESHYKKDAESHKKALGLMQIKLSTATFLIDYYKLDDNIDKRDLFNPETNIKFGCMYLYYLNKKFENTETVICAYNAGETVVRSWLNNKKFSDDKINLKEIPYKETKNYFKKINENLKFYKKYY